jgi:sulfatase maturation enzyme AslB (radical SAM superfamily)
MSFIDKAAFAWAITVKIAKRNPFSFSFNISDRCPVGCDCYWRAQARVLEMTDEAVCDFFVSMRNRGFKHATLIGGEPYVRAALLEKVTPIMQYNWVVTSGTTPLRQLPKTTHMISIDGKDPETHDRIRVMPGLFNRIVGNLKQARTKWPGSFPAFGHSVLNSTNYRQIKDILYFWKENTLLDGILFSVAAPILGTSSSHLRPLSSDELRWVHDELLQQKKTFKDFLRMSIQMIDHLHPDMVRRQIASRCKTSTLVESFHADGTKIDQCVLSSKADCSGCGCVITGFLDGIYGADLQTLRLLSQVVSP